METEAEIIKARRARWQGAQDCWQKFAEAFLVGKRNFLFEGGEEGILNSDTVKEVIARYDSLRGKNREADFIDAAVAAYSGASRPEKLLFAHALFIYKLIVKPKTVNEENIGKKQNFVNCLNLGDFVGGLHWDGVAHTGMTCNECSVSVDYILNLLKHLADKDEEPGKEIRDFCEKDYDVKETGAKWMVDVLLWYVAPGDYEPIISRGHKQDIVKCKYFKDLTIKSNRELSVEGYDDMAKHELNRNKLIRLIREAYALKVGRYWFTFYDSDVKILWAVEQKFMDWMKAKEGKTQGTIDNYVSLLKNKLSDIAKEERFKKGPLEGEPLIDGVKIRTLFYIKESVQFEEVKKELEANEEIISTDKTGNNKQINALKCFGRYLAQKKDAQDADSSYSENAEENGGNKMTELSKPTKQHPLNQIFYGPPGTGKTYDVVGKALEIIGCDVSKESEETGDDKEEKERKRRERRNAQMELFNKLRDEGQIAMVTFHENFAYEEFIEGIKPVLDSDDNNLSYEMAVGIFKEIAKMADENRKNSGESGKNSVDVEEIVEVYAEHFEEDKGGEPAFIGDGDKLKIKDVNRKTDGGQFQSFVLSLPNGKTTSFGIASIKRNYELLMANPDLRSSEILPVRASHGKTRGGNQSRLLALLKELNRFDNERGISSGKKSVERKNYVLIIDEINRGNLSRIFGELITLIESDKRLGQENELRLTLPYSKEDFGVPDNLYIIGTMNTADRSTTKLDTALRRRFHFVEMMPDPEKAAEHSSVPGVDCGKLLKAINRQIRLWRDREHQIGHTYFMGLKSIDDLKDAFQDKIIPLLQEYFFADWEKIDLALNKNGFIVSEKAQADDEEMTLYEKLPSNDSAWTEAANYRKIYGEE